MMAASLLVMARVFATTGVPAWIPPALTVRLGVPSPLTGMTRSFVALASGHIGRAFGLHPLGPFVVAACVAGSVIAVASWVHGKRFSALARLASNRSLWYCVAAAFAAVWIRQILVFR
jgi:hypothetical protein